MFMTIFILFVTSSKGLRNYSSLVIIFKENSIYFECKYISKIDNN